MINDYQRLLKNLQGRRYDEALRESIYSDSFEEVEYADSVKYCLEAMEEIDPSYAYKAFAIAKKLQDKIGQEFTQRGLQVDSRYQGPIQTETHVMLFGGIELLLLQPPKDNKPWLQVRRMTTELMDILTSDGHFNKVDYSDRHYIKITTSKPKCEISILPGIWLDNKGFQETKREIDRGVIAYDFLKKTQRKYLPFKHIARINAKDNKTNGGLKRLTRLLNAIVRDFSINLSNYEMSSLLYAIPEKQLTHDPAKPLSLLPIASAQLNRIVLDQAQIQKLISPSEKELVFGKKPDKPMELARLKKAFDGIMSDVKEDLAKEDKNLYSEITY